MRRTPTESDLDRPAGARLVVVGSGSLARAVCWSLAAVTPAPVAVTVLARSVPAAEELAYVAGARAALAGRPLTVTADPAGDLSPAGLAAALGRLAPTAVLVCASHHSPWERTTRPSGWTELVARGGFGLTLPLQVTLAADVARAVAAAAPDALLLNACFPDAVNPVLAALGLPVHCGVGNAAIVAASLQAALGLPDQAELAVLAHHVHLHEPAEEADEALAWYAGAPVEKVGGLLAAQRSTDPREVNQVTGMATALLLGDLLAGAEVRTNLPGPLGLPGGYPVLLRGRDLDLRLPAGLDRAAAVARNQRMADLDGVRVDGGRVLPAPAAADALDPYLPDVASGFSVREIPAVAEALLDLRSRLRAAPPSRGPTGTEHRR